MEDFLELAKDNTDKDLETCGVLGAFLVRDTLPLMQIWTEVHYFISSVLHAVYSQRKLKYWLIHSIKKFIYERNGCFSWLGLGNKSARGLFNHDINFVDFTYSFRTVKNLTKAFKNKGMYKDNESSK